MNNEILSNPSIWITWESQRRNRSLSQKLGARLIELQFGNPYFRYIVLSCRTIYILIGNKNKLIFVQNPSLLLATLAVIFGKITGNKVVVDAHNSGVFPFEGRKKWALKLSLYLFKNAMLTIVTNERLAGYIKKSGGEVAVLPDPVPEIMKPTKNMKLKDGFNVLFICTWAEDEPYLEVLKAAESLEPGITIYITGKSKGKEKEYSGDISSNIVLTGFVSDEEFDNYLYSCDVVMDLTTREDCLVCGAYEAVSVEKPLILSDTKTLKSYFNKGAIYVDNSASGIVSATTKMRQDIDKYSQEISEYKTTISDQWIERRDELLSSIDRLSSDKSEY